MSSYLTSPFVLEERRLQGIVDQCSHNFYCALLEVEEQEKRISRLKKRQEEKDSDYYVAKEDAVISQREQQKRLSKESKEKKAALEEHLKRIEIELDAFSKQYEGMESAMGRQRRLTLQLRNTFEDFAEIEQCITKHEEDIWRDIRTISEKKAGMSNQYSYLERNTDHSALKGVSLQIEKKAEYVQDSPVKIFEEKLKSAMASTYAGQYISLNELKEQYEKEEDYAKAAFAVSHMKQLEAILKQLEGLSTLEQRDLEERSEVVLRYKAVCRLMRLPVDEKLIADEKANRMLMRKYNEYYKKYEEKQKEQYITESITSVMEKHGIFYQNSDAEQEDGAIHFEMENALLDVSGMDSDRLIMEVSGEYAGEEPTLNEKRKSVSAAGHFCSLLSEIETELERDYGIVFRQVLTENPSEETIKMKRRKTVTVNKRIAEKKEKFI